MISQNPHFKHRDRAIYELGHLLADVGKLPSRGQLMPAEQRQMAESIEMHATNAYTAVIDGIEAIGGILYSAGTNKDCPPGDQHVACIGSLIRHLAVEAQFLQNRQEEFAYALRADDQLRASAPPARKGASA